MKGLRTWFVRTVKNGAVTINGKTYYAYEPGVPYDGRLDGKRCHFGIYWEPKHDSSITQMDFIYLHSTVPYRDKVRRLMEQYPEGWEDHLSEIGPDDNVVDGQHRWTDWRTAKLAAHEDARPRRASHASPPRSCASRVRRGSRCDARRGGREG